MAVLKHYYVQSQGAVKLAAFRQGQSPFAHRYVTDQTVFALYCDRLYPLMHEAGEDPIPAYWKLRNGVLLYDVPEMPLEIVGPDAVKLLERVFVCSVESLSIGRARYALACNENGTMVMDGVIMRLGPERYWYVKANGEFTTWLRANGQGLDVEVRDPNSRVLQIQGPKSLDVLNAAIGGGLSGDFRYYRAAFFDVGGQTLWVSRTGWTGEAGIEIYCNSGPEPTDYDALWDHLLASGKPFGLEFSSGLSMGIRRVEAGILDNGSDIESDLTPFGAGLGHFVNFDKGDFIGRAALEAADRSQLLFGLVCPTATPASDMAVHFNNAPVGHITIGTWSPTLDTGIGYVRFDEAQPSSGWLGQNVLLYDSENRPHQSTVELLPFIDKDKQLPRVPWPG